MQKIEIYFSETCDLKSNKKDSKKTMRITKEQFAVIEHFANTRKDKQLNTIYKLNDCEFRVMMDCV